MIKYISKIELNSFDINDFVIIDGNQIKNGVELLTPFYEKYNLKKYVGTYSLDTFEDIFSDKDFINSTIVKIAIINYEKLLINDKKRKELFLKTLYELDLNSNEIQYDICIIK